MANYKSILFEQMIKDFAETEVKPLAQEVDEQERFPAETVAKMAKMGLMGIIVPREYEGAGGDYYMYISAVLANKLPGPGTIYLGQELKFTAPVFLGDTITAECEIAEIREDKHIVKLNTTCTNQDGKVVIAGMATVKF